MNKEINREDVSAGDMVYMFTINELLNKGLIEKKSIGYNIRGGKPFMYFSDSYAKELLSNPFILHRLDKVREECAVSKLSDGESHKIPYAFIREVVHI